MNAIATIQPSRLPIAPAIAKEFDLQPAEWRVLVEQIFPTAKSVEAVTMALAYCRARKLDIYKKPVHIVPMWSATLGKMVETVWPGIAEIRTTATRTGEYAGIDAVEWGDIVEQDFTGSIDTYEKKKKTGTREITKTVRFPEWASVIVYRWVKGKKAAFHTMVFWEETYGKTGRTSVPNDMWANRPRGQFDKCLEAAALRKAFPEEIGSMYAAEEMEGRTIDLAATPASPPAQEDAPTPAPSSPPSPPSPDAPDDTPNKKEPVEQKQDEPFDVGDFLHKLDEALAVTSDTSSMEEVWSEFDVESTFEGDDNTRALADKIKDRHLARIEKEFPGDRK